MQIRTSVIRYFYVILSIEYVPGILLMIRGHFQGQFEGRIRRDMIFQQIRQIVIPRVIPRFRVSLTG